jgi:hypothetical protein
VTGNPYTARLLDGLADAPDEVTAFVQHWDRVEALVVDVYRRGAAGAEDEAEWRYLRGWLTGRYAALSGPIHAADRPEGPDPFRSLLAWPSAGSFAGNRLALGTLPGAREALNGWLLAGARKAGDAATE